MIVPMSKYSFLVYAKEHEQFLEKLKSVGVLHVRQNNDISEVESIKAILEKKREVFNILDDSRKIIKEAADNGQDIPTTSAIDVKDGEEYVEKYKALQAEKHRLHELILSKNEVLAELYPWGEFDTSYIAKMSEVGLHMQFWNVPKMAYDEAWESSYGAIPVNEVRRVVYFVTISPAPIKAKQMADASEVQLPEQSYSQIKSEIKALAKEMQAMEVELVALAANTDELEAYLNHLEETYRMGDARLQGVSLYDDQLIVLEGWTPTEQASEMEQVLDAEGYAYAQLETGKDTDIPIKLKNNFFSRCFEPLVRLFSLPNYTELDPTPLIAPFFMLFFALCFGDFGYGLIVFSVATYFKRKLETGKKDLATLFQYLGGATMVTSFFTGTVFGVPFVNLKFLAPYKAYILSQDNFMLLSIVLGFVQIIFAKFVSAYKMKKQKGTRYSISHFAWAFLVLFGIIFFGLPQLDIQLPEWSTYLAYGIFAICAVGIFFFNSPKKNVFVNVGSGIWRAYNTASGLLGDSLSYIRLFAIGLAGGILGGVFNSLALDMTASMPLYIRWLPMLLILVIGHSINFGLCMIGALVHPIRLIFVEYFNNAEYEGGGVEYRPLQEISKVEQ